MRNFLVGKRYCKRCASGYDGNPRSCPHCSYNPKQKGLRVALVCFLLVVIGMMGAQISLLVVPFAGQLFLLIAGIGFVLTLLSLVLAYLATPSRLGRLFLYF